MMKNLLRVLSCLIAAVTVAMAQQSGESRPQSSGLRPTGDVLVRALLAADHAQNKREMPSVEELKRAIDQEIVKSAAFASSSQISSKQAPTPKDKFPFATLDNQMLLIDGAVYYRFDDTIYPVPGGGASGCFDPDAADKVHRARMKFAAQNQAGQHR
jgi:hypothetical protein